MKATVNIDADTIAGLIFTGLDAQSHRWISEYDFPNVSDTKKSSVYDLMIEWLKGAEDAPFLRVRAEEPDARMQSITKAKLQRGLQLMVEDSPEQFAELLIGRADMHTADAFLQYCVFGDLIY